MIIINIFGYLFVFLKIFVIVLDIVMCNLIFYFCICVYVIIWKSLYFKYNNFICKEILLNSKIFFFNVVVLYNEVYFCVFEDLVNVVFLKL